MIHARVGIVMLLLLSACGSDDGGASRPDLVPSRVQELPCPGGCAPLRIEVCIENVGPADASPFVVSVSCSNDASFDFLAAGDETCVDLTCSPFTPEEPIVIVDRFDEVAESDEGNNDLSFPRPSGTRCDAICGDLSGAPVRKPTPPPPSKLMHDPQPSG